MKSGTILAALLALAAPLSAGAQQPTIQQQFDAAAAARDAENWPEALRLFEALEARTRNPRTLALVRLRKGTTLIELGRLEEAEAAIRLGLPGLPADDATLDLDRFHGLLTLGRIAEHELLYPEALRQYRLAAAIPVTGADRLLAQRGIVQTEMFTDAPAALREADVALQLAASAGLESRAVRGQLHTLKGRALLNLGRFREARRELEEAHRLLGYLTARVDRADLIARSDLAIAALLDRRPEDARRYLAFTGAGRFERGSFRAATGSALPRCGPDLAPNDVAVIEAIVGTDGRVGDAKPVYASRQGPSAIEFARAVRGWSFDAEGVRNVPALFRSVVRVEVRCSQEPAPEPVRDDGGTSAAAAIVPVRCDPPPRRRRVRATSADFPNDAARWGFEGWAISEMAVAPDGTVAQSRTVMAYPPFVFGDSALGVTNRILYEPAAARDGRPCFAGRQAVAFRLPGGAAD